MTGNPELLGMIDQCISIYFNISSYTLWECRLANRTCATPKVEWGIAEQILQKSEPSLA